MKTTYIYRSLSGMQETTSKDEAITNAEEPIIVKMVDNEGQYFLSVINPELIVVGN